MDPKPIDDPTRVRGPNIWSIELLQLTMSDSARVPMHPIDGRRRPRPRRRAAPSSPTVASVGAGTCRLSRCIKGRRAGVSSSSTLAVNQHTMAVFGFHRQAGCKQEGSMIKYSDFYAAVHYINLVDKDGWTYMITRAIDWGKDPPHGHGSSTCMRLPAWPACLLTHRSHRTQIQQSSFFRPPLPAVCVYVLS